MKALKLKKDISHFDCSSSKFNEYNKNTNYYSNPRLLSNFFPRRRSLASLLEGKADHFVSDTEN